MLFCGLAFFRLVKQSGSWQQIQLLQLVQHARPNKQKR
jgi:hypothetical protein